MASPLSRPRLVFMGTPDLARVILSGLASDPRWDIALVVAQPDKAVGRGLELRPPPVKVEALARGLPVSQPTKARDVSFITQLQSLQPDLVVVAAYGQLLPASLLAIPRRGCLNIHTSILPRWRGAAPIQWAIAEGDAETGVTLMQMDAGLDTGPVVAIESTPIHAGDTGATLHDRLAAMGAALLARCLPDWLEGRLESRPQPGEGVTYARKLTRDDGRIDWNLPAATLANRVRAFDPWPGAFTHLTAAGTNSLLKIWGANAVELAPGPAPGTIVEASADRLVVATGAGGLMIREVQREGRRRMTSREFIAGGGLRAGEVVGAGPATTN